MTIACTLAYPVFSSGRGSTSSNSNGGVSELIGDGGMCAAVAAEKKRMR